MDAPKPTLARMERRPASGHNGEEEGRRKKQRDETDPSAAKPKSKGLRYEAVSMVLLRYCNVLEEMEAHPCRRFRP